MTLMREHVKLAGAQKLAGVVAIHWRTEETRLNLDTFARFARDPNAHGDCGGHLSRGLRERVRPGGRLETGPDPVPHGPRGYVQSAGLAGVFSLRSPLGSCR